MIKFAEFLHMLWAFLAVLTCFGSMLGMVQVEFLAGVMGMLFISFTFVVLERLSAIHKLSKR